MTGGTSRAGVRGRGLRVHRSDAPPSALPLPRGQGRLGLGLGLGLCPPGPARRRAITRTAAPPTPSSAAADWPPPPGLVPALPLVAPSRCSLPASPRPLPPHRPSPPRWRAALHTWRCLASRALIGWAGAAEGAGPARGADPDVHS